MGSAQVTPQKAFATRPARAMMDKYPQSADSAASALSAALAVNADSWRFCQREQKASRDSGC